MGLLLNLPGVLGEIPSISLEASTIGRKILPWKSRGINSLSRYFYLDNFISTSLCSYRYKFIVDG
jgi:hypothetical protein